MPNKLTITVKASSRADYMGHRWFKVFVGGAPLMEQGVHVRYKAKNAEHALAMHKQLCAARKV